MRVDAMIPLIAFWGLFLLTVLTRRTRARLAQKPFRDWFLDVTGLLVQGALIPLLEVSAVFALLRVVAPSMQGSFDPPVVVAVVLNFVVVDYLYYWNHRGLHHARLWPVHAVHHSITEMDVLGTSRNPVWASFLIVYVWVNGAFLFVLRDPAAFVWSASITAALDLWRHSSFGPRRGSALYRLMSAVLITPSDHAWHHADALQHGNYGANLSVWDRLHGTWIDDDHAPTSLGVTVSLSLWRKLLWPFAR